MLLIIAINKGWTILQYDVKNAFVHTNIDANIYTILPIGIYNNKSQCCHLKKAIYGLKQSPRLWYKYLSNTLLKFNFKVLPYDKGVYINNDTKCILICHVDDILAIHKDPIYIRNLMTQLREYIKIEEMGPISTFLGNEIQIKNKTLHITQTKYIEKLLTKFNIYNNNQIKPVKIPGEPGIKLYKNTNQANTKDITEYQKQVGSLLYLVLKTRPDMAFATIYCSRFISNPNKDHFNTLLKIWKYLLYTDKLGLNYNCSGSDLILKGYCDADWANDLNDRKSTSGYLFSLSYNIGINNPISWNSQLQKSAAISTCEAEYMSLREATKEAIYLSSIFNYINTNLQLKYTHTIPKILLDSLSAKRLAENPEFHKRTKHIDLNFHFTRQAILNKKIALIYIPTKYQLADFLTKNVPLNLHKSFVELARLTN